MLSYTRAGGPRGARRTARCYASKTPREPLAGRRPGLLLASRSGPLRRTEGDPGAHGLLLYRSRGTPKLPSDLTCRGSWLRERPERRQFTGAPGGAIVRWTSCH